MDVEILARLQFALTIMFHYLYPPLSIGLGVVLVIMEGLYLATGAPAYKAMAKFWTKIFALTFSIGVATGIVMEFEFGTNWAAYSRFVGDVFGSALAAEGIFAFFLESGFLALLLFGWNRIGPKTHFFATLMVCLGAHFSAVWIVVANSWMQTPAGFVLEEGALGTRAVITDFWAMVFNPSSVDRLTHTILGAWLAGAFLVVSISAYYLLKGRYEEFAKTSLKIGLGIAVAATLAQAFSGHSSARGVASNQPPKLAAFEGLYKTKGHAPLALIGWPNAKEGRLDYSLEVPGLLSYLVHEDLTTPVQGLDATPVKDWPNVSISFISFHLMLYSWGLMLATCIAAFVALWRGSLYQRKWLLRALVVSVIYPQIANQAGWVAAEVGRYPWIVWQLMRVPEGLSQTVKAEQVLGSIIMFGVVYLLLFTLFIYLLDQKVRAGPYGEDVTLEYGHMREYVRGGKDS